jgi:hypothetical protein
MKTLLISLILFSSPAFAKQGDSPVPCDAPKTLAREIIALKTPSNGKHWEQVRPPQPDEFGGHLYTVRPLTSHLEPKGLEGDIGAFARLYPQTAADLGITFTEEGYLRYPDAISLNARIERYNKKVAGKGLEIDVRFWNFDGTGEAPARPFLEHWANGEAVFAMDGINHYHDRGSHLVALLMLPKPVLERSKKITRFLLRVRDDKVFKKNPKLLEKFDEYLKDWTDYLDTWTYNINKISETKQIPANSLETAEQVELFEGVQGSLLLHKLFYDFSPEQLSRLTQNSSELRKLDQYFEEIKEMQSTSLSQRQLRRILAVRYGRQIQKETVKGVRWQQTSAPTPDLLGGHYNTAREIEEFSDKGAKDIEGDLRQFIEVYPNLTRRLGISVLPNGDLRYPDVRALNARIEAYNKEMRNTGKEISVRFWRYNGIGQPSELEMLRHWAKGEQSISDFGSQHFQDVAVNMPGTLFIPDLILRRSRSFTNVLVQMHDDPVLAKNPRLAKQIEEAIRSWADEIRFQQPSLTEMAMAKKVKTRERITFIPNKPADETALGDFDTIDPSFDDVWRLEQLQGGRMRNSLILQFDAKSQNVSGLTPEEKKVLAHYVLDLKVQQNQQLDRHQILSAMRSQLRRYKIEP